MTTDGTGNWVAVWQSDDDLGTTIGTDRDILTSRSLDGGSTWTAPVALGSNAASDSGEDFNPQADSYRARMEERARHFAESILHFLRDQHEDFRDATILGFPNRLGIREGHRLQGLRTVEETDILTGQRSEDEVAVSLDIEEAA